MTECVYQRGLHSKSRTTWLICGAYVLTCSMCLIFVFHLLPVMSDKSVQMRLAVSEAQAVHACISLWILREDSSIEEPFSTSIDECSSGSWWKGVVWHFDEYAAFHQCLSLAADMPLAILPPNLVWGPNSLAQQDHIMEAKKDVQTFINSTDQMCKKQIDVSVFMIKSITNTCKMQSEKSWYSKGKHIFDPTDKCFKHNLTLILFSFTENMTSYLHFASQVNVSWFKDV